MNILKFYRLYSVNSHLMMELFREEETTLDSFELSFPEGCISNKEIDPNEFYKKGLIPDSIMQIYELTNINEYVIAIGDGVNYFSKKIGIDSSGKFKGKFPKKSSRFLEKIDTLILYIIYAIVLYFL